MKNQAGQPHIRETFLKPCSRKHLCQLYGISYRILRIWLKPIAAETGPLIGRYITSAQLKIIYNHLGYPEEK
jgi:hypothetical protein